MEDKNMKTRKIKKVYKAKPVMEGAGVALNRVFGYHEVPLFDPFLLLDDFRSDNPDDYLKGFPWHPHRGIETITYMLEGKVEHGDSMKNTGIISSGDVQWMTAGSGIIHQEMPKGDDKGRMYGFQLWANLPASHKMIKPRYQEIKSKDIPEIVLDNKVKIKVICGNFNNITGPVKDIITDPVYLDITVPPDIEFSMPVNKKNSAFAYVIDGNAYFCKEKKPFSYEVESINYFDMNRTSLIENRMLVQFDEGEEILVITEKSHVRFLFIAGNPLNEPVAWYGPIVMNTQEELRTAFDELDKGTFIK